MCACVCVYMTLCCVVSDGGGGAAVAGKKCRARYGLEHQSRWCKPCRSVRVFNVSPPQSLFTYANVLSSLAPRSVSQLILTASSAFLRATAGTAIARLSHRNSVRLSVRLSVTRVDQAKTVQARIIKSSPAPKTQVSGSVMLFQKFHRGHPNRGP